MKRETFKLGDQVSGTYHDVAYTGRIEAYDGSGYIYVTLDAPITVYRDARTSLAIDPRSEERDSLRLVRRDPIDSSKIRSYGAAAMGIVALDP